MICFVGEDRHIYSSDLTAYFGRQVGCDEAIVVWPFSIWLEDWLALQLLFKADGIMNSWRGQRLVSVAVS